MVPIERHEYVMGMPGGKHGAQHWVSFRGLDQINNLPVLADAGFILYPLSGGLLGSTVFQDMRHQVRYSFRKSLTSRR